MAEIWAKLSMLDLDALTLRQQVMDSVLCETPYAQRDITKLENTIEHLQHSLEMAKAIK